ncbi:hypothetical protein [Microvirga sp. VF16]|uniref:hypothetical protein n=1 Tax=Microvirga sp. VF16 TaxID=2807101 RepID=UPI00193CB589|nr:hypothetical protein [Microvirga sp. VF16]QRM36132.1 hypothetical protein JO965_46125 [Microvirga sp. VF16]
MIVGDERSQVLDRPERDRVCTPDILPKLQSLLANLANIDTDHESNLIVIESRPMDDACKRRLIADLCESHRQRRAPYLREIEALREQMEAAFH